MDAGFGANPWLNAKLVQLLRLAAEDMEMMMKEAILESARLSRRPVAKEVMAFSPTKLIHPCQRFKERKHPKEGNTTSHEQLIQRYL